jgi:hypothetical protein
VTDLGRLRNAEAARQEAIALAAKLSVSQFLDEKVRVQIMTWGKEHPTSNQQAHHAEDLLQLAEVKDVVTGAWG